MSMREMDSKWIPFIQAEALTSILILGTSTYYIINQDNHSGPL